MNRTRKNRSLHLESLESRSLMAADLQATGVFAAGIPDTREVVVGDVNGDRIADVVAIGATYVNQGSMGAIPNPVLNVFLGDGRGGFTNSQSRAFGLISTAYGRPVFTSPVLADVNGDSKLDLIVGDKGMASGPRVMLGDRAGRFADPYSLGGDRSYSVATGDFNRDGKVDLVVLEQYADQVRYRMAPRVGVLLGNGAGGFTRASATNLPGSIPSAGKIAVGDFNRDGNLDAAVTNDVDSVVNTLFGRGDGGFDLGPNLAISKPTDLTIGDFTGDGADDLAVLSGKNNSVVVWKGNADRSFAQTGEFAAGSSVASLAAADLDGDRIRDLAIANWQGTVTTLTGRGDGTFGDRRDLTAPQSANESSFLATDLAMADFNNDGRVDVAIGGRAGGIGLLTNNTATAGKSVYKLSQNEYVVDEGARFVKIVVNRTGDIGQPASAWFRTSVFVNSSGAAVSGADFSSVKGRINFAAGETTKTVLVPIIDDKLVEGKERFLVSVSDTETLTPTTQYHMAIVYINDNDQYGTFQFAGDLVYNPQTGTMTATIERINGNGGEVDIRVGGVNGGSPSLAQPGVDYDFEPQTIRFFAGETRKTIEVRNVRPTSAGKYVVLFLGTLSNGQFGDRRAAEGLIG